MNDLGDCLPGREVYEMSGVASIGMAFGRALREKGDDHRGYFERLEDQYEVAAGAEIGLYIVKSLP